MSGSDGGGFDLSSALSWALPLAVGVNNTDRSGGTGNQAACIVDQIKYPFRRLRQLVQIFRNPPKGKYRSSHTDHRSIITMDRDRSRHGRVAVGIEGIWFGPDWLACIESRTVPGPLPRIIVRPYKFRLAKAAIIIDRPENQVIPGL